MSEIQQKNKKILTACRTGDQQTLEELFEELAIGPDQPKHPGEYGQSLAEEQRTPTVQDMISAAIDGQQISMVNFLFFKFPNTSLDCGPLAWATRTGNSQLVEAMCKLDPAAADGAYAHVNLLVYASQGPENADIVSILLKAGADPNKPAEHTPPFSNTSYAVTGNMPALTFEEFFDHGYRFDDGWAVRSAVQCNRPDVLEVLFRRGGQLPTARFDSKEELIELAFEVDNLEMVDVINRVYPVSPKKRGFVGSLARILRFKS
ncbi:hypothetical protein ACHAPT_002200 [Fusarium lateritium]